MSKRTTASLLWERQATYNKRMSSIERLTTAAQDYTFPAGQAQAGIQLATVEVPWLLAEIERLKLNLKDHINDIEHPTHTVASVA
jgi:hypothetical protein